MIYVVPKPSKVVLQSGTFELKSDTVLVTDRESKPSAEWLSAKLGVATGYKLAVREGKSTAANSILFSVLPGATLGPEGYDLTVTTDRIVVRGAGAAGVFYACQTIRQLLPTDIESSGKVTNVPWSMPCVKIEDKPRFGWRGCLISMRPGIFSARMRSSGRST